MTFAANFHCDADAGVLLWKRKDGSDRETNRWNSRYADKPAGRTNREDGYNRVAIKDGDEIRRIYAHRIIWEMAHGEIPAGMQIDHINGNRADNRLSNLRLATFCENMRNKRSRRNSTSRFLGVCQVRGEETWRAQINVDKRVKNLGRYVTEEEAALAYNAAAKVAWGEFANLNAV